MKKTVLVVGGSSGIGQQIRQDIVNGGIEVINASRNPVEGILSQQIDVTQDFNLDVPEELHGLVYCPGTINLKPFNRISIEDVRRELEVNYLGAVRVLHQTIDSLKKGKGSVVLFSTVAVKVGMPFHSSISAAKGAVEGLTKSLAAEYAPHIRFNAIAPSLTDTPLASGLLNNERKQEANAKRHPLQKVGQPKDISSMATYLLSDSSSWITGQIMHLDGGISSIKPL